MMRVPPTGSAKPTVAALPKAIESRICVGGVITFSPYSVTNFVQEYRIIFPGPRPKTLEDFRSPEGQINLNFANYNEVLPLSSLDALHKGFIRTYFNQVQRGVLPSTKSLAGWIKSQNRKIKTDSELLVLRFLLDLQDAGFSLLSTFDDPLFNKVFMAYSRMSNHDEISLKNACRSLEIQSEKSEIRFANEVFNKLKVDDRSVKGIASLSEDFSNFAEFISRLKEDAFNYLADREQLTLPLEIPSSESESLPEATALVQDGIVDVERIVLPLQAKTEDGITGFKCEFLDSLEIDYRRNGFPSQHSIATTYTSIGNLNKRARLHEAFHNFNMKHILPVEVTYSNNRNLKLFLPVAVCKEILHDLSENGQSSYNLSQWIK